ncbi:hypothetical protein HHL25_08970 [Rhizobium sp. S-51]|uniref:Uncharacterized protein n=1 Tax=Rhizobium terricola TaxID=2728849 RepID=A0A7Y0FVW1_9HYPH|nr:hypothetical protein [Rhizobium terricola]NML74250.1 hypothetical protein [Rhizobium terricola]
MCHTDVLASWLPTYAQFEQKQDQRKPAAAGDADLESFVTDCKAVSAQGQGDLPIQ